MAALQFRRMKQLHSNQYFAASHVTEKHKMKHLFGVKNEACHHGQANNINVINFLALMLEEDTLVIKEKLHF